MNDSKTTSKAVRLYIIDPKSYKGNIENTMDKSPDGEFVHYMEKPTTFEQYKAIKGNENLVALEWEEFRDKYHQPYLNSLQEDFVHTTEEDFQEALECLPPAIWARDGNREFFFAGEAFTGDLHYCYVRLGNIYYKALRSRRTTKEDIYKLKTVNS